MKPRMKWMLAAFFSLAVIIIIILGLNRELNPEKGNAGHALASVGDQTITAEQFIREMTRRSGNFHPEELKERLLEDMIQLNLLYTAALKAGYDNDPDVMDTIRRLVAEKYRSERLVPLLNQIKITDEELEHYYKSHPSEFRTKKMWRAAVIQISIPKNASSEKKARLLEKAVNARKEALELSGKTRSFGSVAVKYSDHQSSRYRGGDTGWLAAGETRRPFPLEVLKVIYTQSSPGDVSPLITTPTGFFIIKSMGIKESAPYPFDSVKTKIHHQLLAEKKEAVTHAFYEKLKSDIPVHIDTEKIKTIDFTDRRTIEKKPKPPALPGQ